MFRFGRTALLIILAFMVCADAPAAPVDKIAATQDIDRSVKPGEDFYRYANGGWLGSAAIPEGQSSYGTSAQLVAKNSQRVRDLIQDAAASHAARGSVAQKVGDYFASFMDEASIEAK